MKGNEAIQDRIIIINCPPLEAEEDIYFACIARDQEFIDELITAVQKNRKDCITSSVSENFPMSVGILYSKSSYWKKDNPFGNLYA